ncbi:hypothetical protein C8R48DRAFT_677930 [Suillus tomentosus]|nr:hypothetical protein C8R48DRAFT_677930 [Suillus tomentosus]
MQRGLPVGQPGPTSEESVDAGALELGVESAWNLDDVSVSGLERSDSIRAEPPSGEPTSQTGSDLAGAVIDGRTPSVPTALSTPLLDNGGNELKDSPDDGDGLGSVAMSISPPLAQCSEQERRYPQIGLLDSLRYQYRRHDELDSDGLNEMPSWADLPINDDLGDVPDLKSNRQDKTIGMDAPSPRIPMHLKGKSVMKTSTLNENERGPTDDPNEIDALKERIRDLERLVCLSQLRESEANQRVADAHCAPKISVQSKNTSHRAKEAQLDVKTIKIEGNQTNNLRYQRASSLLPADSSIKRAMTGASKKGHDPGDPDPGSSDDDGECSSTESDLDKLSKKASTKKRHTLKKNSSENKQPAIDHPGVRTSTPEAKGLGTTVVRPKRAQMPSNAYVTMISALNVNKRVTLRKTVQEGTDFPTNWDPELLASAPTPLGSLRPILGPSLLRKALLRACMAWPLASETTPIPLVPNDSP